MEKDPENIKDAIIELKERFKNETVLLDYNIIDFTYTYEFYKCLKEKGDKTLFSNLFSLLSIQIKNKTESYLKEPTLVHFSVLQSYIVFFMVLTINLKNNKEYIKCAFDKEINFFSSTVQLIEQIKYSSKTKSLYQNINNLFLEEFKSIFFIQPSDEELEDIYITNQASLSEQFSVSVDRYDSHTYTKMFNTLLSFNLSYENFFDNIKENENQYDDTEDFERSYKLCIAQSIIRCAFSKEKTKYYPENDLPKYFEFTFLETVIYQDMIETKRMLGNKYTTLFRKEDLKDDIIKYLFFIFGNEMFINVIEIPLKKVIEGAKKDNINEQSNISFEQFDMFFNEMIGKIDDYIPLVLQIVLKLIYVKVGEVYTIEPNNYHPLFSSMVFNYFVSPRVQSIYHIDYMKNNIVSSFNRLFRNICYNALFDPKDDLAGFNEKIGTYHDQLDKFITRKILPIDIDSDDTKQSICNLFTEQYIIYPKCLFYSDSIILGNAILGGFSTIVEYQKLEKKNKTI